MSRNKSLSKEVDHSRDNLDSTKLVTVQYHLASDHAGQCTCAVSSAIFGWRLCYYGARENLSPYLG